MEVQQNDKDHKVSGRWTALIILTIVYTVYNIDRNLVVILAEPIKAEFGLSDSQLGLLTGTSFAIAFGLAGIPIGLLVDRVNRVRLISALLAIWSIVTFLCGFVRTFTLLILTRIGVGVAESGAAPTCLSILSDFFPKHRRGTAFGLFYLSTPIGLGIGFAIGGVIAKHIGWREVFMLAGAPGVILALLVMFFVREPKRGQFDEEEKGDHLVSSFSTIIRILKAKPTLILLTAAAVLVIAGQAGMSAFLPSLFVRHHALPIDQTGYAIAVIMGVGGAIGMPFGGAMSDYVTKRSARFSPLATGYFVLAAAPFAMIGCLVPVLWVSITTFFIYSVLIHCYLGPTLASYMTLAPPRLRGAMSAFLLVAMNLVGFGVGPQLTGVLSDIYNANGVEESIRYAMLTISLCIVASGICYLLAARTMDRDVEGTDAEDTAVPA
ncbi:spinster family MFS transporter [Parvularcula marina]|uniref:MFS transporter n=1 Tax=Parvularcula marina TaxID=2292771 RepID=A0A371RLC8_9PROT|nr:MFS transporter [Parvularcula marina]RFB06247.1 MFS transporter [Parvularcula marina]